MGPQHFVIERWAAWAPGLETEADWAAWSAGERSIAASPDKPDVSFLPALQRRRASRVSRAALWAAHHCGGATLEWPTIFASRHGELHRSMDLMTSLAAAEPVSPNSFSLSVHNSVSGLYGIATGNRAASTALSAGRDTLAIGVIEALGQLRAGAQRVLLVDADACVPAFYRPWVAAGPPAFALDLVLREPTPGESAWQLSRLAVGDADTTQAPGECAVELLHLLAGHQSRLQLAGEQHGWLWRRA